MTIEELQELNCNQMIPSKWNIYRWAEKHPGTTIDCALKRVEKIFDLADGGAVHAGFSSGKDSTLTANLALLELNMRNLRVQFKIMRDGGQGVDPLDQKWFGKKLALSQTDAEVCWTSSNDYTKRFVARNGPETLYILGDGKRPVSSKESIRLDGQRNMETAEHVFDRVINGECLIRIMDDGSEVKLGEENCTPLFGHDLINYNHVCLPMSWQSGVSFDSGILISWDPAKKDMWVQPMPTRDEMHGFDPLNVDNLSTANPVPLNSLHEEAQEWHRKHGNVIKVPVDGLFAHSKWENLQMDENDMVEAVANFGRGPTMQTVKVGTHEKEQQDDYSHWFAQTSWVTAVDDQELRKQCKERIEELYDLSKDVWQMRPAKQDDRDAGDCDVPAWADNVVSVALISLRAEESLDRRVILSQGEYSTGQYSNNGGMNVCSPVFDLTTADVWRLLSATDWDVNDIYEKMYEAGIGIGDQRVGSLLNYAAIRQIATVKALEPDLYGRINQRFSNVEFMAQFSRSSYFKISKPRDTHWDGKNHIKAGVSPENVTALSDQYEEVLKMLEIPYRRDGNEFWTEDPECKGKPWFPLRDALKSIV